MLDSLIRTDLMAFKPDVDAVDIWMDSFSIQMIPAKPGVYCFYDADTGEILYIGSACARSASYHQRGLAMRLQFYRSSGVRGQCASVFKVNKERVTTRILVRCWVADSVGDARKYEYDAIEKWKPKLNHEMSSPIMTQEQYGESRKVVAINTRKRYIARPRSELPGDETSKRCSCCGKTKMRVEFHKNRCRVDGRSNTCKVCKSEDAK
jgi:hypothetical protein